MPTKERPSSHGTARPAPGASQPKPATTVCIAGMHRSGTSMVVRILQKCGVFLGSDQEMMPASADNEEGFWEHLKFVELNDALLATLGRAWDHPPDDATDWDAPDIAALSAKARALTGRFHSSPLWGWKDPRNSLTLPFWLKLLPNLKVIICLRNPLEVALSLHRRNYLSYQLGLSLWESYDSLVMQSVPKSQRLITHYDAYFEDPAAEVRRILRFLGADVAEDVIAQSIATVSPKMRHSRLGLMDLMETKGVERTAELYQRMCMEAGRSGEAMPDGVEKPAAENPQIRNVSRNFATAPLDLEFARRENEGLLETLAAHESASRELRAQLAAKGTEVQCRLDEIARRDAAVRELQTELANRAGRSGQEHTEKLISLSVEVEKERLVIQQLTTQAAAREAAAHDLQARFGVSKSELDRATASLADLRTRSAGDLRQRDAIIERIEADLGARREALREAVQENRDLHARLADSLSDLARRESEIENLRAESRIREHRLEEQLVETHAALLKRDEEFRSALSATVRKPDAAAPAADAKKTFSQTEYGELILKIRNVVDRVLPGGATVLVVNRGDEELLHLGARRGWHFPRTDSGHYAGHHPADSAAAIQHLEKLRRIGAQFFLLPRTAYWWLDHFAEFREHLRSNYRVVHDGNECAIFDIGHGQAHEARAKHYGNVKARMRETVCSATAEGATILVVSKGDEELVALDGREGRHFPQNAEGEYAGHHPADSAAAMVALEALRECGASYLVLPETSFWWLEFYKDFAAELEVRYSKVREDESCIIYHLAGGGDAGMKSQWARQLKARSEEALALLTQNARLGVQLKDAETRLAARSIDVFAKSRLRALLDGAARLTFPKVAKPVVSIVIPTFNQAHCTCLALEALLAARSEATFEIVIVDNASTDETRALLDRLDNVTVRLNPTNLGFGDASTAGARIGRGEFICFLNNDTVPAPGWLDALVHTARTHPRCGAVGAKLVHADGRLQEAGSIIWRDGSALGYGRGGDPHDPAFNYVKEVDFCSAACLLISKKLLLQIGAFDEIYAPAYYEDADLCMAIRKAGWSVIYQPRATVFHLEFGSSGAARAVELQLRNRTRFVAKWRKELRAHCEPLQRVPLARDRRQGKRILVVDDRIPHMSVGSGFPRLAAMLRILVKEGFIVTFLPRTNPARIEPETADFQQLGIEVLHGVKDIRAALEGRAGLFDAAIVSRPHNTPIIPAIRECNPHAVIIYDAEAICAFREARQAEIEGKPMTQKAIDARIQAELDLMKSADVVMAVSESECRTIRKYGRKIPVALWGHAVKANGAPAGFRARRDLLFVGNLATPPNADALIHFGRDILPKIREEVACRLVATGANPPPELFQSGADPAAIQLTGYVEDLEPLYARCRVFVAPHRFAAGIPLKVVDAMAQGVPCVVSELLAGQLGVKDGVEVLVGRGAKNFAEKTKRLYRDERLWKKLQRAGLEFIRKNYDPEKMAQKLRVCIDKAIAKV